MARIDIGKGDSSSATGNGQLERKIAFLSANRAVVNPPGNEVGTNTEPFNKFDLFSLGRKPVHARMFQDKIKREKPPHHDGAPISFLRWRMFSTPSAR